jgi:two-component system response regulator MprA
MRILVVDDDPKIVSLLKRGLTYEGYTIDTASDGSEVLAKARQIEPDVVVLDIMMPGVDGVEVSKRLRQADDVPILMVTAKGTVTDKIEGLDSGSRIALNCCSEGWRCALRRMARMEATFESALFGDQ